MSILATLVLALLATTVSGQELDETLCDGQEEGYMVVVPGTNCEKYVTCTSTSAKQYRMQCAAGTSFDEDQQMCDFKASVTCPDLQTRSLSSDIDCNMANDYHPDPNNCSVYYQCDHGTKYKHECNIGTIYSPETKNCVHPEDTEACNRNRGS